jgi:GNAT superfamily N-acetyltransferase
VASELDFRAVPAGTGDGAALVAAMIDEMRELYWDIEDGLDLNSPGMPKAGPVELGPPAGTFLVGYRDGVALCGGGVKPLPDGTCEIKRMYVVPAARGQGLARVLLHALEDAARDLGYQVARLDTGPRQQHAQRLYESRG